MTRPKPAASDASQNAASEGNAPKSSTAKGSASRSASSGSSASKNGASKSVAPSSPAPVSQAPVAPGSAPRERISRWSLLLVAAALGAGVGFFGSFGHRATATLSGVSWPTGLVLCLGGLLGLLLGLGELLEAGAPRSWRPTRLSALGCASAGWLVALLWLSYFGPPPTLARKGDVILPNDWKSLAYLLGGMALVTGATYRAWAASLSARLNGRPGAPGSAHPKG